MPAFVTAILKVLRIYIFCGVIFGETLPDLIVLLPVGVYSLSSSAQLLVNLNHYILFISVNEISVLIV